MQDDRENDWLAQEMRLEGYQIRQTHAKGDPARRLKALHTTNCDAGVIRDEHARNCDAEEVRRESRTGPARGKNASAVFVLVAVILAAVLVLNVAGNVAYSLFNNDGIGVFALVAVVYLAFTILGAKSKRSGKRNNRR